MAADRAEIPITSLIEPIDGTCSICNFDSLVHIRLFFLQIQGISEIGTSTLCARCADEDEP